MKTYKRNLIVTVLLLALSTGAVFAATTVNSASSLSSENARVQETSIGDLVADAVRASQNADIAFISASELKEVDIAKGRVSSSDIAAAVAYPDDPIALVQLSGQQVKQALEKSVSIYDQKNLGFLQVSGLKFNFKKTSGNRVSSVSIKGEPVDESRTYTVAVSSSLADGALGYWRVWTKDQVVSVSQLTVPQAVENFLKGKNSIDYGTLNRITVIK